MMHSDPYMDPAAKVLRNKLGITDPKTLYEAEIEFTRDRLYELQLHPIPGDFDFDHLKRIHAHIFQDLYDWAGCERTVNISKGSTFCLAEHIESFASQVFSGIKSRCAEAAANDDEFVTTICSIYSDINALHPFREGNGRAQREFIRQLCVAHGRAFDLSGTTRDQMLEASIEAFAGDEAELATILHSAIVPLEKAPVHRRLSILSIDKPVPFEELSAENGPNPCYSE